MDHDRKSNVSEGKNKELRPFRAEKKSRKSQV